MSEPPPIDEWRSLAPKDPSDVCTCNHPRSTHGEQRVGEYCWGGKSGEPYCECPGFAFKRLTRLEQIRWEHERAARDDPEFSATTVTGLLLAEIDRLTAEVAHRRQQNRELAAMEENARKQHRAPVVTAPSSKESPMFRLIVSRPDGTQFQSHPTPLPTRHDTGLAVIGVLRDEGLPFTAAVKRLGGQVRDAELGQSVVHEASGYQFRTETF